MRRLLAATCGLLLLSTVLPAAAQETLDDARARREALAEEAAAAAGEIDVLEAEDDEIVAALEQIDQWVGTQQARLERAQQDLIVTLEAEEQARTSADELESEITRLRDVVTEQSVRAYIEGFAADDEILLGATDINSVPVLRFVLDETSGISADVTDQLRVALDDQRRAIEEAERAAAAAVELQADIRTRIEQLEDTRQTQEDLRAEIERRIEELETTTAVLAAEDAEIEAFIRAEIARLAALEEERRREAARLAEEQRLAEEAAATEAAEEAAAPDDAGPTPEEAPAEDTSDEPNAEPTPEANTDEAAPTTETDEGVAGDGEADSAQPEDDGEEDDPDAEPAEAGEPTVDEAEGAGDDAGEPEPASEPAPDPNAVPSFIRPVPGAASSGYGYRIHPIYGTQRLHTGIDFNGGQGTPIGAAAAGTVIFVDAFSGYGNTVIVQHTGGYTTLYAHMSGFNTTVGASVAAGDTIGFIGSTGLSTGPHLHFEIRLNGGAIDPSPFL